MYPLRILRIFAFSREFEKVAIEVMEACYEDNDDVTTEQLLLEKQDLSESKEYMPKMISNLEVQKESESREDAQKVQLLGEKSDVSKTKEDGPKQSAPGKLGMLENPLVEVATDFGCMVFMAQPAFRDACDRLWNGALLPYNSPFRVSDLGIQKS